MAEAEIDDERIAAVCCSVSTSISGAASRRPPSRLASPRLASSGSPSRSTHPGLLLEAAPGIEPGYRALQALA
jgi:hypothetical protein